jgi:hypothetical protein
MNYFYETSVGIIIEKNQKAATTGQVRIIIFEDNDSDDGIIFMKDNDGRVNFLVLRTTTATDEWV